ncbi:N-acetylmuramoyl-L-alanine amidase [Salinisphaera sp. SPP-AMP-43]|uniref:N-acetylmuramoyl-L-alanine amidase n=1 Tax=Salinisphaera sp. SPP-AMP-43 TaxID=3121288 RepID=UPI003C6DFCDE
MSPFFTFGRGAAALLFVIGLVGCGAPATLKQRLGYWADQSVSATAYNHRVRFLVLHFTSDRPGRALRVLTGPHVSAHYLIDRDPDTRSRAPIVHQLVAEDERAWHAGVSSWAGRHHINDSSIGIEIVNLGPLSPPGPNRRWQPYTEAQIQAVIALARDIVTRYDIKPANVVGHSDVAPGRKIDPGPAFPWQRLHEAGIGAWPDPQRIAFYARRFGHARPSIATVQRQLADYGYDLPVTGELDQRTRTVLRSFQMHFRPANTTGLADVGTLARLWALNERYR